MRFLFQVNLNGKPTGEPPVQDFVSEETACGAAIRCLQGLADLPLTPIRNSDFDLRVVNELGVIVFQGGMTLGLPSSHGEASRLG